MRGLSSAISVNFTTTALGVISSVILARLLGPAGRGEVTQLMYFPQFVYGIAHLSVGEALILLAKNEASAISLKQSALRAAALIGILAALCTVGWILATTGIPAGEPTLLACAYTVAYLPGMILVGYLLALMQADDRHLQANGLRCLLGAVYSGLLGLLALGKMLTPAMVLASSAASIAVAGACSYALLRRHRAPQVRVSIRVLVRKAIPLHITTALNSVNTQIDRLFAVYYLDATELGIYIVGWTIASSTSGVIGQTIHNIIFPRISKSTSIGERVAAVKESLAYTLGLSTLAAGALYAVVPSLNHVVFGQSFDAATPIARTLVVAWVLVATRQVASRIGKAIGCNHHNIAIECVFTACFGGLCLISSYFGQRPHLPELFLVVNACAASVQLVLIYRSVANPLALPTPGDTSES